MGPEWMACSFLLMLYLGLGDGRHFPRILDSCPGSTSRTMPPLKPFVWPRDGPNCTYCPSCLIILGTVYYLSIKSQGSIQFLRGSLSFPDP